MKACVVKGCNTRGDRAGGYCTRHVQEYYRTAVMAWHTAGVPKWRVAAARAGENARCVDCEGPSLDGGLRCVACFGRCSLARREDAACRRERLRREREAA